MERSPNITTLATDLDLHCTNWGINPRVTKAQRELWPGEALRHAALGADDPRCLRLLRDDGHDGEAVGSCTTARAARFFSATEHLAPPGRDLVRFGVFCHLGVVRTLHLVVKNQWEEFVIAEKRSVARDARYDDCVTTFEEGALARLLDRFRLEVGRRVEQLHRLLEEHGDLASRLGLDRGRLATLVDQMILSRVHCCGATSPELACFEARQEREDALLREADREQQDEFWLKKSCWLTLQAELEDKLLLREDTRLRNFNLTTEWMALFGAVYVDVLQAQTECHHLERRTAMKKADPSLSDEEIEKRVSESIAEELASIEELRREARDAASLAHLPQGDGEYLSEEQLDRYREEAKRLIREIWRLTHPDTLHGAFTPRQREKLREFLEQVVKIRRSEAQLDVRAISVLSEILAKVKELYGVMGVDLEPTTVIGGDTLGEQTAWLESEIQRLESQLQELMAEIQAMSMDPDVREKMASMADEDSRKATQLALERMKQELEARRVDLAAEHERVFGTRRTTVACG